MNNIENESNRIFSIAIGLFYLIIIGSILICGSLWWNNKSAFYLNSSNISMITNESYSIGIYGSTKKNKKDFIFSSSNPSIATVDSNGIVKAISDGEVTITVKSRFSKKTKTVVITIEGDTIYSIDVNQEIYNVKVGNKFTLTPIVNEDRNFYADLVYTSSNPSIVSVDKKGNVRANKKGSAYISIKVSGSDIETKVLVNVEQISSYTTTNPSKPTQTVDEGGDSEEESINNNIPVKDIRLIIKDESLVVNGTTKVTYALEPINATDKRVTFASNNTNVATVDQNGNVRAISPGIANISVTSKSGNKTSYVTITVNAGVVHVNNISLNKTSTTLEKGNSEVLNYNIEPSIATNQKVIWSSSNTNVVTVDQSGKITAKGLGKATITVTTKDGNKKSSCIVEVVKKAIKVKSISLNKSSLTLKIGNTYVLKESINPSNATNQNVKWTSSNKSVVSVENGKIKALKPGKATITVTSIDGSKKATCVVTVPEIKITKITLKKSSAQVVKGNTYKLNVSITPDNATNKKLTYKSANESIATVSSDGTITAKRLGQTIITVKTKDGSSKTAKFNIVVVPAGNYIDIRKQKYTKLYYNLNVSEKNIGSAKHMQNFSITDKYIYLSTVTQGCYSVSGSSPSGEQIKNLSRTLIFRFEKNKVKNNSSKISSNLMYLKWGGHGQGFTVDPKTNVIFTTANLNNELKITKPNPAYKESGGRWWGVQNGLMQLTFKANKIDDNYTAKKTYKSRAEDGSYIDGSIMPSIDKDNNLIGLRTGSRVRIYDYNEFLNGNYKLIYSFRYTSPLVNYAGTDIHISNQGFAIKNGYFYVFRGTPGKKSYIEVFDFQGNLIYYTKTGLDTNGSREPEGLQIYGNKIYIGTTHYDSYRNSLMDIGYYK